VGATAQLPSHVDALIAGAGPAGLTAALELARSGASALLVDARERIGAPLRCGEVTFDDFFDMVGVDPRPAWIRKRGLRQRYVRRDLFVLDREIVERELAELAAERGAEVRPGTAVIGVDPFDGTGRRVTLRTAREEHRVAAGCVIAADGVSSTVARLAGIDTYLHPDSVCTGLARIVSGARVQHQDLVHTARLPAPIPAIPCYFWVIPHGGGQANVGLTVPGRDGARARRLLEQMLARIEAIEGGEVIQTIAGVIPDAPPLPRPFADGLLITGAAARMILPLSAGGIAPAAISGKHAARTVIGLDGEPATAERLATYREALEPLYSKIEEKWDYRRTLVGQRGGSAHG
jgi:digeranylgeranylglycerophospholipid reductase